MYRVQTALRKTKGGGYGHYLEKCRGYLEREGVDRRHVRLLRTWWIEREINHGNDLIPHHSTQEKCFRSLYAIGAKIFVVLEQAIQRKKKTRK